MEGWVYILQSQTSGMYYIGCSGNVNKRLVQHNDGATTATKNKGPWIVVFKQNFPTMREARQMEYRIKRLKRRDIIKRIIEDELIKME